MAALELAGVQLRSPSPGCTWEVLGVARGRACGLVWSAFLKFDLILIKLISN